jgi:predicted NAD-dependent protein-ADP-ribosyltransferase YbiA (DUF1768 family)
MARHYETKFADIPWQKDKWGKGYKDTIMKRGLTYKFSQNKDLLDRLVLTCDSKLVERSFKDPYWGGALPDSKNMLGNYLMQLRDNYVKEKKIFIDDSGLEKIEMEK